MDILGQAQETIRKYKMLTGGERVLIALSGGADSVSLLLVLASLMEKYRMELHSLYIDHGLRPKEAPKEASFAKKISEEHGVIFHQDRIDVLSYAKEKRMGKQESARELRYSMLEDYLRRIGGNKIALGHTADDQVETFLMRFLRGAGPKGLAGIPPVRGHIIRPLIEIERADIEEYLKENKTGFMTDTSNLKLEYSRNRIRKKLVPVLREFNPNLSSTVLRTVEILTDEERYFENIVLKSLMKLIPKKSDEEIELFMVPLESMDRVILRRVLRKAVELTKGLTASFDFSHIEDVIRLIKEGKPGDRLYLPGKVRIIKKYSTLLLTSRLPRKLGTYQLNVPGELRFPETGAALKAAFTDSPIHDVSERTAIFDSSKIKLPLTVRARKTGDFFFPAGFGKRKKLQDFFVDEKVPRDERDEVPIVLSGDDIIWVAGYRADERFRSNPETRNFLVLELKS